MIPQKHPFLITRYAPPTSLDTAEKGTLCKVSTGLDSAYEFYVQMNSNQDNPQWLKLEAKTEEHAEEECSRIFSN